MMQIMMTANNPGMPKVKTIMVTAVINLVEPSRWPVTKGTLHFMKT